MKKHWKAGALALAMTLALTACGGESGEITKFDAAAYVDGLLQENYLGQFEQSYLELVGIDEEIAQDTHERCMEQEVGYFTYYFDVSEPTDEIREEFQTLLEEIYSHTRYEVISAAEQEDGSFSVKVEVEPIDIIQLVRSDWDKSTEDFYEEYPVERINAMSDAEYEKMDQEWAQLILELVREKMPEIGNQTSQSIVVQVEKNEDGYYSIVSDDFSKLHDLILDYSGTEA